MLLFATILFFTEFLTHVYSQRASTWGQCNCYWGEWDPWSKCSRLCYGSQVRSRKVWLYDTPECLGKGGRMCDGGAGFYERRACNTVCSFGTYDASSGGCRCPAGRYGTCCDNVVTCGNPQTVNHGTYLTTSNNFYGSIVTYSCDVHYNMTGSAARTCQSSPYSNYGYWTESKPTCLYAESCRSSPCKNGATCINGLGTYTCTCVQGWSGVNCEQDIQPPVMENCGNSTTQYTGKREIRYNWTVPAIWDPFGNEVVVTANYHDPVYSFPWGDFFIQYVGTKHINGMQKECKFKVEVRPKPCGELNIPTNGYVACNGWRSDYGEYCQIGCFSNYTLPRDLDSDQWYVCGASGTWSFNPGNVECEETSTQQDIPTKCLSQSGVKEDYITNIRKSEFKAVCINHSGLCTTQNVAVRCIE